ncbi:hypothetical protein ACQY0O_005629 [Thecaphora frezii]
MQPVWAAPVPTFLNFLGAYYDAAAGHLGSLKGEGNRRLNYLAKNDEAKFLTDTRKLAMWEPETRIAFREGVKRSKLNRRFKALKNAKTKISLQDYDRRRADPSSIELKRVANGHKDDVESWLRTVQDAQVDEEAKADAKEKLKNAEKEIDLLEKEVNSFNLPEEKFVMDTVITVNGVVEAYTKLGQHLEATRRNLNEASEVIKEVKAKLAAFNGNDKAAGEHNQRADGASASSGATASSLREAIERSARERNERAAMLSSGASVSPKPNPSGVSKATDYHYLYGHASTKHVPTPNPALWSTIPYQFNS